MARPNNRLANTVEQPTIRKTILLKMVARKRRRKNRLQKQHELSSCFVSISGVNGFSRIDHNESEINCFLMTNRLAISNENSLIINDERNGSLTNLTYLGGGEVTFDKTSDVML